MVSIGTKRRMELLNGGLTFNPLRERKSKSDRLIFSLRAFIGLFSFFIENLSNDEDDLEDNAYSKNKFIFNVPSSVVCTA